MVLALLAGAKTQTRRLVKGDVVDVGRSEWWGPRRVVHLPRCQRAFCEQVNDYETACGGFDCGADGRTQRSPYGAPGDRLWVKETWRTEKVYDELAPRDLPKDASVWFEADGPHPAVPPPHDHLGPGKGRPSIFMMRYMSRLLLGVTEVRVERLQDISEADAKAEGVRPFFEVNACIGRDQRITSGELAGAAEHRASYACLWDEINDDRATWKSNPWVWVVSFARLDEHLREAVKE